MPVVGQRRCVTSRTTKQRHNCRATSKPDNRNKKAKALKAYCAEYLYEGREPGKKDSKRAEAANVPDGEKHGQEWLLRSLLAMASHRSSMSPLWAAGGRSVFA
jgi:demethoxyubiquinone hydroxylase (CLK1/Coq7/Cat5 family)